MKSALFLAIWIFSLGNSDGNEKTLHPRSVYMNLFSEILHDKKFTKNIKTCRTKYRDSAELTFVVTNFDNQKYFESNFSDSNIIVGPRIKMFTYRCDTSDWVTLTVLKEVENYIHIGCLISYRVCEYRNGSFSYNKTYSKTGAIYKYKKDRNDRWKLRRRKIYIHKKKD